jgi:hypothetical protein
MGMAANMAAIVPAALLEALEHGTSGEAVVYCMFQVYHGPSTRDLCHLFGILGKGIEWIDAPAPRGWAAGSGPLVVHRRVVYYVSCLSGPEPYTPV